MLRFLCVAAGRAGAMLELRQVLVRNIYVECRGINGACFWNNQAFVPVIVPAYLRRTREVRIEEVLESSDGCCPHPLTSESYLFYNFNQFYRAVSTTPATNC